MKYSPAQLGPLPMFQRYSMLGRGPWLPKILLAKKARRSQSLQPMAWPDFTCSSTWPGCMYVMRLVRVANGRWAVTLCAGECRISLAMNPLPCQLNVPPSSCTNASRNITSTWYMCGTWAASQLPAYKFGTLRCRLIRHRPRSLQPRNSLDHANDPLLGIRQMIHVVRPAAKQTCAHMSTAVVPPNLLQAGRLGAAATCPE